MSPLSTFFKDIDNKFGVCYPNHCLMAVFPNLEEAWKFLEPRHPLIARHFSFGGIERLAGEN